MAGTFSHKKTAGFIHKKARTLKKIPVGLTGIFWCIMEYEALEDTFFLLKCRNIATMIKLVNGIGIKEEFITFWITLNKELHYIVLHQI